MACERCCSFEGVSSNYEYLGINVVRHAELYRCKNCEQLLEIIAEARAPYLLTFEQAEEHFPDAKGKLNK